MTGSAGDAADDIAVRAAAFDALPSQVALLDREGTIRVTNDYWLELAVENDVSTSPDMVGEDYLAVCDEAESDVAHEAAAGIRAIIDGEQTAFRFEYPCHGPNERRWFLMRAIPVTHHGEEFVLVMHTNITARREAELAVDRRNEVLELLTGILSHDLRNPMSVAMGRAELLEDDGEFESDEHVAAIRSSLERMDGIIEDALTLARETELEETATVDLETVATNAWSHVKSPDTTLSVPATASMEADASLLMQALENLLRNAIEHGGDDVTVTIGPLSDDRAGFFVADDGPGIPARHRDAVFEPGYMVDDDGGTGLGLAIVEQVASAHGWDVVVTESEAGGARFEFTGVTSVE